MRMRVLVFLSLTWCLTAWGQDSLNVTRVGSVPVQGSRSVAVSGNLAYVAAMTLGSGLRVIDVSDPQNPFQVGSFVTTGLASGVAVRGALVYLADGYNGLRIFDVADPSDPVLIGELDTPGFAYDVKVVDSYAYVADYTSFEVIDISDPNGPYLVGSCPTQHSLRVAVNGDHAYVADGQVEAGLSVIDISNPALPIQVGSLHTRGGAAGVSARDGLAYVGFVMGGLSIVDVSDPMLPIEVGYCHTTWQLGDVAVNNSYAFGAESYSGLRVISISDPAHPVEVGYYHSAGGRGLTTGDSLVYHVSGASLTIFDCSRATGNDPLAMGELELVQPGPPNWGYRLWHVYGLVDEIIFTNFCPGTSGSVTGPASANWIASTMDDSISFSTSVALTSGTLDTFWLYHPSCANTVHWCITEYCGDIEGPLPVEFLGIAATCGDGEVTLTWRTASEVDNDRFEIERDGELAGSVLGQGNSTSEQRYTWTDTGLINGRSYHYALFSVALNGDRAELAQLDAVPGIVLPLQFAILPAYPNPFNASTQIRFDVPRESFVQLRVYDVTGRLVDDLAGRIFSAGTHSVTFDGTNRASGMYLVRMSTPPYPPEILPSSGGGTNLAQKMLLLK